MSRFPVEPTPKIAPIARPFAKFAQVEAAGGIVLIIATVAALIWANSPWSQSYFDFWKTYLTVSVGGFEISHSLGHWVNDGLMALFFFVVGLEIKRELIVGELSSFKRAALPIAAAIGGMVAPALVFVAFNAGTPEVRGWAIPMATDIAFAMGVLALVGPRVPLPLRVFLAALAIADDLGAVLVIAIFYTESINGAALGAAGGLLALLILANVYGVRWAAVYALLGLLLWVAVLKSGVHATIAGVALALTVPARVRIDPQAFLAKVERATDAIRDSLESDGPSSAGYSRRQNAVHSIEVACDHVEAPLLRFEHALVKWSAFLVIPIFALANAGIDLGPVFSSFTGELRLGLGIALGLLLGKTIGITLFTWVASRLGLGELPAGVTWRQVLGVSLLAGIGFTMSIFIAGLAFKDSEETLYVAKSGIFLGSLIAGIAGFILLRLGSPASGADDAGGEA